MWEIVRRTLNSSWQFSLLLSIACLVLCWQLSSLISILVKLRKESKLSARTVRISDLPTSKENSISYPEIISRVSAVMLIGALFIIALGASSISQFKKCTVTGDIWKMNDMIVDGPDRWPNSWKITSAVDHHQYTIVLCPPSPLKLRAGNYIEWLHAEYRDGCLDASGEDSNFKVD